MENSKSHPEYPVAVVTKYWECLCIQREIIVELHALLALAKSHESKGIIGITFAVTYQVCSETVAMTTIAACSLSLLIKFLSVLRKLSILVHERRDVRMALITLLDSAPEDYALDVRALRERPEFIDICSR